MREATTDQTLKAIYHSAPMVESVHIRGISVMPAPPRDFSRVCLYINGKACSVTDACITHRHHLYYTMARWERTFNLDGKLAALHVEIDGKVSTYVRVGYGRYYES